jgi:ABC-type antimicrobial peptide transport system permease subunit
VAIFESPLPYFYFPLTQEYQSMRVLQLRASVPPESLRTRLDQEIRGMDSDMPVVDLQTMTQALAGFQGYMIFRIGAMQAGVLGMLGLVLATVGVYGVVSYGATQRTREIGIRMALGATPRGILTFILGQGAWMVASGVAVGFIAALGLSRLIAGFLLLVSATDPFTFASVPILLGLTALLACYIPARRAMKVDPIVALRHE